MITRLSRTTWPGVIVLLILIGLISAAAASSRRAAASAHHGAAARSRAAAAVLAAAPAPQQSSSSTPPPAPVTGNPRVTISAPTDGSTSAAGTAVTLQATFSADLITALQAGTTRSCYFTIAADVSSTVSGTIDLNAGTCTASWTFSYAGSFAVTATVTTASLITYGSAAITVNTTGGTNPRCTGSASAPNTCVYKWAEVYYNSSNTRFARVCSIDGGCQWQTTHTSWTQQSGSDYWVNSTGQPLADGNLAEAYLCIGASPASWTTYTTNHNFDTLEGQSDTNAKPVPAGTC